MQNREYLGICPISPQQFFIVTVINDISKQIKQRGCLGKIVARWRLEMAITCFNSLSKCSSF